MGSEMCIRDSFWGLPEALRHQAEELQKRYPHDIIDRYQNLEYVKEIKGQHAIERPWKYDLFKSDCGDLEQYIPRIILIHLAILSSTVV